MPARSRRASDGSMSRTPPRRSSIASWPWPRRSRREGIRPSTCSAWAAAACARKCCAVSSASRDGYPRAVRDGHDRRADDSRARGAAGARARAVPRLQQERRHGRSRLDGAVLLATGCRPRSDPRPDATSWRSPIPEPTLQKLAESRGYREVFLNPPDIGGRFSALSLFGLVPAALIGAPCARLDFGRRGHGRRLPPGNHTNPGPRPRRVHRRGGQGRTRQADGRPAAAPRVAGPVD